MRWPWHRKHGCPSDEAQHAERESQRGIKDARVMREIASDAHIRATEMAARLAETKRRNHFGEAVQLSMRRSNT